MQDLFDLAYRHGKDYHKDTNRFKLACQTRKLWEGVTEDLLNSIIWSHHNASDSGQFDTFLEVFQAQMHEIAYRFKLTIPKD